MNGVPVVSLKVDPDHLIQTKDLGRVSLTMEQLVRDIEILMENQDLWKQTSQRCRKYAEEHFDIIEKVTELEGVIRESKKKNLPS